MLNEGKRRGTEPKTKEKERKDTAGGDKFSTVGINFRKLLLLMEGHDELD
ncbi:MAG: hypothetical protein K2Q09_00410 [Phycisphaerales bacterium]|nr:hypothetical protein [Phycisphaerales bacterium]